MSETTTTVIPPSLASDNFGKQYKERNALVKKWAKKSGSVFTRVCVCV